MKTKTITFLTSIGAGLEYYDYVIYSLLAGYISTQFFPAHNPVAALFATLVVITLANIIRPLGSVILGLLGDNFGRKTVFVNTLIWMAGITLLMGIMPAYATLGITATIIFSCCRVLQGVAFGAELPGALTFLLEHTHGKRQGFYFGCMIAAVGLGVTVGSFVIYLLTQVLSNTQMQAWGFRIPFIFGSLLAVIGFFIRKKIGETPQFLAYKTAMAHTPKLVALGTTYLKQVLKCIGVLSFPASYITFGLVLPTYLHNYYHYRYQDIYFVVSLGHLWTALLLPVFGWLSDYVGNKRLFIASQLAVIIFAGLVFNWLNRGDLIALYIFMGFFHTITSAMAAGYFILLPRAFPTQVRFTGTALSYNTAYAIAALVPLIANYILAIIQQPIYLVLLFCSCAGISLLGVALLRNHDDVI